MSYWFDSLPDPIEVRRPLPGDTDADVVVVGAGFTGLWTAHYLLQADPHLRVVVIERETAGFGASGRNGGWCSALFATSPGKITATYGSGAEHLLRRALEATVDEVASESQALGIDCHFKKGGTLQLARSPAQLARARAEVAEARALGVGEEDLRLLGATEARAMAGATRVLGATYTPHCAAIHPARLARGLADAVERAGAVVYEQTPVLEIAKGRATTGMGTVRAPVVVRATEGYSARLPASSRDVIPFYSLMVATEPLPAAVLDEIGLSRGETFSDHRHLVIYGQRTLDDRIAFGGRGAPYHFGSRIRPSFDRDRRIHGLIHAALVDLFPTLKGAKITHRWGGPLGISRDWHPSVGFDRASGLASAGGYVGDGVAVSNLAGRTLAALVTGSDDSCTRLCWVGHRSRSWEPEPLRWLGVNAGLKAMGVADRTEERTGKPSRVASAMSSLLGG